MKILNLNIRKIWQIFFTVQILSIFIYFISNLLIKNVSNSISDNFDSKQEKILVSETSKNEIKLNEVIVKINDVSNDDEYNSLLKNYIQDIKTKSLEDEFYSFYQNYFKGTLNILEFVFLNKVLVSLDNPYPTIKKVLSENAYFKNNAFKVYDLHREDRPSEIFNMARAHLLEILTSNNDSDKLKIIEPELINIIKKELDLNLVRHALKTWKLASESMPQKDWFSQRSEGEIAKLIDLI